MIIKIIIYSQYKERLFLKHIFKWYYKYINYSVNYISRLRCFSQTYNINDASKIDTIKA